MLDIYQIFYLNFIAAVAVVMAIGAGMGVNANFRLLLILTTSNTIRCRHGPACYLREDQTRLIISPTHRRLTVDLHEQIARQESGRGDFVCDTRSLLLASSWGTVV